MVGVTALLVAVLIGILLDKALPAEERQRLGTFRLVRAHVTIGIFGWAMAYAWLRGILSIMGH